MSAGHTLITIFAMMLLTTILLNFYRLLATNGDIVNSGQDGILMSTLATSYMEVASGLAFDSVTDTSDIAIGIPSLMTLASKLGTERAAEDSLYDYDDFDDFNGPGPSYSGSTIEATANGTTRKYKTTFRVYYVNPGNIETISATQTFVKRLDITMWRTFPPGKTDTLKVSTVSGYFHFD